jgi:O-antigen ligase
MTTAARNDFDGTSGGNATTLVALGRACLCTLTLLIYWVSLEPFHDRSGADLAGTLGAANILNQVVFPGLCLLVVGVVALTRPGYYRQLAAPAFLVWIAWLIIATLVSNDPSTGFRRGLFEIITMVIAAGVVALPDNPRQFAGQLAIAALAVLALCYVGVVLFPSMSVHSASDVLERELAGDWRGIFAHKNQAGAMMVVILFTGLYIAEVRSKSLGWTLIVLAGTFLLFSKAKSSIALFPFTIVLSALVWQLRSTVARLALIVVPLIVFNTVTIGCSWPGPIRNFVGIFLANPTFTARTDLWRFSIEQTARKPIFGHGLTGPWRTSSLMYQDKERPEPEDISGWVTETGTDSHNSYLEGALQFGIPGLLILLTAVIVQPTRDLGNALKRTNCIALVRYFSRIWIFVLYLASLETVMVTRNNPIWFMAVVAIAGLHLLARYPAANTEQTQ